MAEETESFPTLSNSQMEDISNFASHVMECRRIPGMNLAVVNRREVLMAKGFGFSSIEDGIRVTGTTLLPIASNTKAFTVTLLAILLHDHPKK